MRSLTLLLSSSHCCWVKLLLTSSYHDQIEMAMGLLLALIISICLIIVLKGARRTKGQRPLDSKYGYINKNKK